MDEFNTAYLARETQGKLIGENKKINGIFNILKDAGKGDIVVRHWIDEEGIIIAKKKGVSCVVTQNPRGKAFDKAVELNLPLIINEKIELVNSFAIKWALMKFAPKTMRLVVTGTNGKSTTSHMIHCILKEAGYSTYTNTDSESEFNTLIDPMVAKQIAEYPEKLDAMVFEVSEVQGWDDRIMEDHAHMMTMAINPQIVVLTNVALDHIGLVNSIEEAYHEISGALRGFKGTHAVLNIEDPLIRNMEKFLLPNVKTIFYGSGSSVKLQKKGIFHNQELIIPKANLPFQSPHFIQNTLAAVGTAIALEIKPEIIKKAIESYQPLKRRFTILGKDPLIIDDFAHNPDGIKATIKSAAELSKSSTGSKSSSGILYVVCAIRGSRGTSINKANAQAVADSIKEIENRLILTSSREVVDDANWVKDEEKKVFIDVMQKEGINYTHEEKLIDSLKKALNHANSDDTVLLIGAQGMDPASCVLDEINNMKR